MTSTLSWYQTGNYAVTTGVSSVTTTLNGDYFVNPYMNSTFANQTWSTWNGIYINEIANQVASTTTIWNSWNQIYIPPIVHIRPSAEALERLRQEQQEREAKLQEVRKVSRQTLLSLLDEPQKQDLASKKFFHVMVGDRVYRIHPGSYNTVEQIDSKTGLRVCSFCIHPYADDEPLPADDWAIAQKLLLDADEQEFLRIANRRAA